MIGRGMRSIVASVLGLMAAAGLPITHDPNAVRHLRASIRQHQGGGKFRGRGPAGRAGFGRRRRQFKPNPQRLSCRFTYARADRQAERDARLRVIQNNDRIENALQEARRRKSA